MPWQRVARVGGPVALALVAVVVVHAQDAARGAALLADAQQAIGGANRLTNVKTLQVTGTFRRVIGNNDTEGDFDVFIEIPARYLRSEKTGIPGQPSTETIEALVDGQARDLVRGGGRGGGGPIGGAGGDGGDAPPEAVIEPVVPDGPPVADAPLPVAGGRGRGGADPELLTRQRQADVSRLILMWLLRSETPLAWVGIAESPDGRADVLEARFADGTPTRLFLEASSHMPLMMQWQATPAPGRGGRGARGQGAPAAAEPVLMDMTFSDYRNVNGIRLPHVITRGMNGTTIERWTVSRYRINPSFSADTFTR